MKTYRVYLGYRDTNVNIHADEEPDASGGQVLVFRRAGQVVARFNADLVAGWRVVDCAGE